MKVVMKTVVSAILAIGLTACGEPTAKVGKTTVSGTADIGGAFQLINQDGELVSDQTFKGKLQLIYFGFGYCPDVCPTALQKMGSAQALSDPKGDKLNYLFITIDPERDTAESLKLYVTANGFPNNLVGLTGDQPQIDQAKAAFKVYSQKVETPDSAASYTVDHSDIIYFLDKDGEFLEFFTGRSTVLEIAERIKAHTK